MPGKRGTPVERFWRHVDLEGPTPIDRPDLGPCYLWTGHLDANGYGWVSVGGRNGRDVLAARFALEMVEGPLPEGLEPDHLCKNPACVRASHLEAVTHRINMLRGNTIAARNAAVEACPSGHPYDDTNTYVTALGHRYCRPCHAARERRRRAQLVAQRERVGV